MNDEKEEITVEYHDMLDLSDKLYNSGNITQREYEQQLDQAEAWYDEMVNLIERAEVNHD